MNSTTTPPISTTTHSRFKTASKSIRRNISSIIIHIFLFVGSLFTLLPLIWMVLSAFKTSSEIIQIPPTLVPAAPTLENFKEIFLTLPFMRFVFNSLFVTVTSTIILVFLTSLAGFVFAKFEFSGKKLIYGAILLTMMIADEVLVLPVYLMISKVHWNNTYIALIIPFLFTGLLCS